MTRFIAFSGKKQVGKDTATAMLVDVLKDRGISVSVTAFAESLKRMCIEILGLKYEGVYGSNEQKNALTNILWDNFPETVRMKYATERDPTMGDWFPRCGPMSSREVLQVMGSDIFRMMIDNDVWARAPFNKQWDTDVVILTDCRFPNEKAIVEEKDGVVIRLERNTGLHDDHISETALDNAAFGIKYHNNGTLEDLKEFVISLANKII